MSDRRPIVGGNWKMNLHTAEAETLVGQLVDNLADAAAEVVICPPLVYLQQTARQLAEASSAIQLGAQNVYPEPNGAFTGEVSVSMLQDVAAGWVITGHSERRHVLGESDVTINAKTRAALEAGLSVILCVGEKIEQREANQTDAINVAQLYYGLAGVTAEQMQRVVIAYEPVWAIGTGKTASADDAQQAHAAIRAALGHMYGTAVADATRIQYGGSVKSDNAAELFSQPDIDGGLIGGASLKAADFTAIVQSAS